MIDGIPRIGPDPKAKRHRWDDTLTRRVLAEDADNGCGQTIRTCADCGMQRYTMHPPNGLAWIEYTFAGAKTRIQLSQSPPCLPRPAATGAVA